MGAKQSKTDSLNPFDIERTRKLLFDSAFGLGILITPYLRKDELKAFTGVNKKSFSNRERVIDRNKEKKLLQKILSLK